MAEVVQFPRKCLEETKLFHGTLFALLFAPRSRKRNRLDVLEIIIHGNMDIIVGILMDREAIKDQRTVNDCATDFESLRDGCRKPFDFRDVAGDENVVNDFGNKQGMFIPIRRKYEELRETRNCDKTIVR